jgi:serine/threonine protein kinase
MKIDVRARRAPGRPGTWGFVEGDQIVAGRFALERLGTSRAFEVYTAYDEALMSVVALKLIRRDRVDDAALRNALRREGELLRELAHPALPRCFDVVGGEVPHLALEHVDGPRLSTLIRRQRRLGPEQLLPLGLRLCAAIHYLHGRGLVHLDVKPSNVIVAPSPMLIDLSIATGSTTAATLRRPVGTDAYLAPEQSGEPGWGPIGPAADVWGIGATLFHAAAGRTAFAGDTTGPNRRFPQVGDGCLEVPRDVSPAIADVLVAALSRRQQDRPTVSEVADAVGGAMAALPRRVRLGTARVRWRT